MLMRMFSIFSKAINSTNYVEEIVEIILICRLPVYIVYCTYLNTNPVCEPYVIPIISNNRSSIYIIIVFLQTAIQGD